MRRQRELSGVGASLSNFLRESGMTQTAFGRAIGVSQGRVNQLLTGDPWPLDRCATAEQVSGGRLRCESLRPDVQWIRDAAGVVVSYQVPVSAAPEKQVA